MQDTMLGSIKSWITTSESVKPKYVYKIVEISKYHEIIDEFTNSYTIVRYTQNWLVGTEDILESGFITYDQAERYLSKYLYIEDQNEKAGVREIVGNV